MISLENLIEFLGDVFIMFGWRVTGFYYVWMESYWFLLCLDGELLVLGSSSSVESQDTGCSTVTSDYSFPSKSNTGLFGTTVTDSGSEIVVPSPVRVR